MKFRQKFAAVLAALMIATSLPTFAASSNGVNKIITVAKDTELESAIAPELKIELKDKLAKDQTFYLNLENAEWATDAAVKLNARTDLNTNFTFSRENDTQLGVKAIKADGVDAGATAYRIPMFTKVKGGEATVAIDSNDTVVTSGKYVFAVSNDATGVLTVADAKSFAATGKMAEITVEESYIGAFKNADKDNKIRFELEGTGFTFNYTKGVEIANALVGKKAYATKKYPAKVIDATTLEVTIPKGDLNATQRGAFTLEGIEVKAGKDASYGDVNVTVSGDLNDTAELLVAKYGNYGTELKVAKEYNVTAGQELKDIEFTLSETVTDSISRNRETGFTFTEGVTIKNVIVSKSSGVATAPVANVEKKDDKNTNVFTVNSIDADSAVKTSVTFKATLNVPASFTGDINLIVEGRSLEDKKEAGVAKVSAPVSVEVTPITVKAGVAKQNGGKIVIKEAEKGMLSSGKIFLALDDADLNYTKAPEVKVIEGNLKVDAKAVVTKGGIEITVNSKSTKASTLEIKGGELRVTTMVPEGTYTVKVGGTSISALSNAELWNTTKKEYNDIDQIVEKDFIYVGTKNVGAKASFIIGQGKYEVDGIEKMMDTAAYISSGRTMLPVRYVSDALGVAPSAILWDSAAKTVTVLADRVIQIKVGSKEMTINGAKVPMTAAAEMKNDRIFIPVAEIARALGANVEWDNVTKTATFN